MGDKVPSHALSVKWRGFFCKANTRQPPCFRCNHSGALNPWKLTAQGLACWLGSKDQPHPSKVEIKKTDRKWPLEPGTPKTLRNNEQAWANLLLSFTLFLSHTQGTRLFGTRSVHLLPVKAEGSLLLPGSSPSTKHTQPNSMSPRPSHVKQNTVTPGKAWGQGPHVLSLCRLAWRLAWNKCPINIDSTQTRAIQPLPSEKPNKQNPTCRGYVDF